MEYAYISHYTGTVGTKEHFISCLGNLSITMNVCRNIKKSQLISECLEHSLYLNICMSMYHVHLYVYMLFFGSYCPCSTREK